MLTINKEMFFLCFRINGPREHWLDVLPEHLHAAISFCHWSQHR